MNKIPLTAGRIARSTAGRDQGRLFVVLSEIDDDFVLTADGSLRKIDRPKKKRRKHLKATPHAMDATGKWPPEDHEIRKQIKASEAHEEG